MRRLTPLASQGLLTNRSRRLLQIATQGFILFGKVEQTLNWPLRVSLNTGRNFIQTNTGKRFIKLEEM